jgi:hypothetical protein
LEEIVYVERLCRCGYNFVACCMHHSVIMDVPSAMLKCCFIVGVHICYHKKSKYRLLFGFF